MANRPLFRTKALEPAKQMVIYFRDEVEDMSEASMFRGLPAISTGMDKEEEAEHHLQKAINARKKFGSKNEESALIPVPETIVDNDTYRRLYESRARFHQTKKYITVQPFFPDVDAPDYDADEEDEAWVAEEGSQIDPPVTIPLLEEMLDKLEKGSGLNHTLLEDDVFKILKEDEAQIKAVYKYWRSKRERIGLDPRSSLTPQVKTDITRLPQYLLGPPWGSSSAPPSKSGSLSSASQGSGSTGGGSGSSNSPNPYVAFRKRVEKMQTRKNRKNDEFSYIRMLQMRRDLSRCVTMMEMVRRRELMKRELSVLGLEVDSKRFEIGDYDGSMVADVSRTLESKWHPVSSRSKLNQLYTGSFAQDEDFADAGDRRQRRRGKKRRERDRNGAPRGAVGVASDLFSPSGSPKRSSLSPNSRPPASPTSQMPPHRPVVPSHRTLLTPKKPPLEETISLESERFAFKRYSNDVGYCARRSSLLPTPPNAPLRPLTPTLVPSSPHSGPQSPPSDPLASSSPSLRLSLHSGARDFRAEQRRRIEEFCLKHGLKVVRSQGVPAPSLPPGRLVSPPSSSFGPPPAPSLLSPTLPAPPSPKASATGAAASSPALSHAQSQCLKKILNLPSSTFHPTSTRDLSMPPSSTVEPPPSTSTHPAAPSGSVSCLPRVIWIRDPGCDLICTDRSVWGAARSRYQALRSQAEGTVTSAPPAPNATPSAPHSSTPLTPPPASTVAPSSSSPSSTPPQNFSTYTVRRPLTSSNVSSSPSNPSTTPPVTSRKSAVKLLPSLFRGGAGSSSPTTVMASNGPLPTTTSINNGLKRAPPSDPTQPPTMKILKLASPSSSVRQHLASSLSSSPGPPNGQAMSPAGRIEPESQSDLSESPSRPVTGRKGSQAPPSAPPPVPKVKIT